MSDMKNRKRRRKVIETLRKFGMVPGCVLVLNDAKSVRTCAYIRARRALLGGKKYEDLVTMITYSESYTVQDLEYDLPHFSLIHDNIPLHVHPPERTTKSACSSTELTTPPSFDDFYREVECNAAKARVVTTHNSGCSSTAPSNCWLNPNGDYDGHVLVNMV